MSRGQLWLFSHPKPLVDRFGAEFFRQLPTRPGVYFFCGASEGVLYVGKAKNLKRRLASYRVANPERFPRRIIRLLHQVRRIEWDECPDDSAACWREELLITVLQPKFNAVGKVWPQLLRSPLPQLSVEREKFSSVHCSCLLTDNPARNTFPIARVEKRDKM